MISNLEILSQSSLGLNGYWGIPESFSVPLYNYEYNSSNYSNIKDWGINLNYGAEFSDEVNSNIYSVSLSKTIQVHNLSGRFSPGFQKEFLFTTANVVTDSTPPQSLEANYNYKELFGLGYSYRFTSQINAGFTLRFFNQNFSQEILTPVFGDTTNYFSRETLEENVNFWKADIGIDYILNDKFQFRVGSNNLLNFGDNLQNEEFKEFEMKQNKSALLSANFTPAQQYNFHVLYETPQSFQASITGNIENFLYGVTIFHDKYQTPFIAGIVPSFGYKTDLFEVLLSGIKYFSDRNRTENFSDFRQSGINNILNNRYGFDKVILSLSLNIRSTAEQKVKLIDVEIVKDIYPTFYENYIESPFAYGTIVNISDETVAVIPSAKIEGVNSGNIQSHSSLLSPGDTARVPYYTVIPEGYSVDKPVISYADFFVATTTNEPDDHLQKALLINGINSWDGRVSNLRYFILKDLDFSMNYSKALFSKHKEMLDTVPSPLSIFYKAKLLFNDFVHQLVYTSDPRASAEYVQFPNQTMELKGGDCDDLSVAFCSFLESVGIQTALVDYKEDGAMRHVNVLFNTQLSPALAKLITNNDSKYFVRENLDGKDEVWLPVETTSLTEFDQAWNTGVEKFNREAIADLGIATGKVVIIDIY